MIAVAICAHDCQNLALIITREDLLQYLIGHPDFAIALATVVSALTAALAVAVSIWALWVQRRHNKISVRPIPEVSMGDGINSISVVLSNNGVGPLVIRRMRVSKGQESRENIIDWMKEYMPEMDWTSFASIPPDRTIKPNGEVTLIELTEEPDEQGFVTLRDMARAKLSQLVVTVEYTDAYGTPFTPCVRPLDWFARPLRKKRNQKKRI